MKYFHRYVDPLILVLCFILSACVHEVFKGPKDQDPAWRLNTVQEVAIDLREDGKIDREWEPWVSEESKDLIISEADTVNDNWVGE